MTQGRSEEECSPPPLIEELSRELHIVNRKGLHARATAKFVQCVDRFDADVKVTRCGETVVAIDYGHIDARAGGINDSVSASSAEARRRWRRLRPSLRPFGEDSDDCARLPIASGSTSESPRPDRSAAHPGAR